MVYLGIKLMGENMRYKYNSKTITVKTDSVTQSFIDGFIYNPIDTKKKAVALSMLLGGYNEVRDITSIEQEKLQELQQDLENILYKIEKTIQ